MSAPDRKEFVVKAYAAGAPLKHIAEAIGHKSHGYVVRLLSEARPEGDPRAAPRNVCAKAARKRSVRASDAVAVGQRIIAKSGGLGAGGKLAINAGEP